MPVLDLALLLNEGLPTGTSLSESEEGSESGWSLPSVGGVPGLDDVSPLLLGSVGLGCSPIAGDLVFRCQYCDSSLSDSDEEWTNSVRSHMTGTSSSKPDDGG